MILFMLTIVYAVRNLLVFLDPDGLYVRLFCAGLGFTEYILLTAALVTRCLPRASVVAGPGALRHVPLRVRRHLRRGQPARLPGL